jgi:hypothetical protein
MRNCFFINIEFLKKSTLGLHNLDRNKKAWERLRKKEIHQQEAKDALNKMKEQLRPEYMKN